MDDDADFRPPTEDEIWKRANDGNQPAMERAQAWEHLAHMKMHEEKFIEAIACGEMAEKCYAEAGWTLQQGDAVYWQGRAHYNLEQYTKGAECFVRASDLFHEAGHEVWLADAIRGAAECNLKLEITDEAIVQFTSAAQFYEVNECWLLAGDCRLELGEARGSSGHSLDALGEFSKARSMFEKEGNSHKAVRASDRMASALIELSRMDEAIEILRTNVDLAVFLSHPEGIAWTQYRLGWTLNLMDERSEAMHWLNLARAYYIEKNMNAHKADVDLQRYHALVSLGQQGDAEQVGRSLRAYWKSVANYERLVIHDANTALGLISVGDMAEATRVADRAARDAKEHCGDWSQRITRLVLAEVHVAAGEFAHALTALQSDMAEQWGDTVGTKIRHLMVLAAIAKSEGRPHEARGITERVIELAEQAQLHSALGPAYEVLADLAEVERDYPRERDMRSQAVALFLAYGDVASANANARKLLPDVAERQRNDEWHTIDVEGREPDVPHGEVTRSSRGMPSQPETADTRGRRQSHSSETSQPGDPATDATTDNPKETDDNAAEG
jgi:tetratricopeptide (TPR) repeat protein